MFQKTGAGATAVDWEALVLNNAIADITALRSLTGTSTGDTDFGTVFTGSVIPDTSNLVGALQSLETYAEATRSLVSNFEWQESVIDRFDPTVATPAGPATGDRYLATATGNGWTDNYIYEWDGAAWIETIPTTGTYVAVDDESSVLYQFGGSTWASKAFENTTASVGLTKIGNDIQIADASAGGIAIVSGAFSLNVDDVTLEVATNVLQVKADGINDTHIDFGTGVNQVSAEDLPIADAGSIITATNVEGALQELAASGNAISDNTITSPLGSTSHTGTVGGDDQTVEVVFSTTGEANRSIEADSLASVANGEGASMVGVEDAAGNYVATDVEGVLTEIDGRLDAVEAVVATQVDTLGNTGATTVTADSVLVDEVVAISWHVLIEDLVSGDREYLQVSATHDGSKDGVTDAVNVDFNRYGKLRLTNVVGDVISVDLSGTGVTQAMRLRATATNGFDVRVVRSEAINL